jgi:hypothetical protein
MQAGHQPLQSAVIPTLLGTPAVAECGDPDLLFFLENKESQTFFF